MMNNMDPQQIAAAAEMMRQSGTQTPQGLQAPQMPQMPQYPQNPQAPQMPQPLQPFRTTPAAPSNTMRAMATGGMVKGNRSRGDGCITKGGTKGRIV